VSTDVIHRIIEQHAALDGSRPAIVDAAGSVTYRRLNARANTMARVLMCAGLRRGGHALVTGDPGIELAVALLAALKSGASYTWTSGNAGQRHPVLSIRSAAASAPEEYLVIDGAPASETEQSSPNLPILSRGCDVACVLDPFSASPVQVPHAAIVARRAVPPTVPWTDDRTAVDLWVTLMNGATLTLPGHAAAA
jgi:non-ribosomal peptide synthetase component F